MANDISLLDEMSHWTGVAGHMQQLLMEHGASAALKTADDTAEILAKGQVEPGRVVESQTAWWKEAMAAWQAMLPLTPQDAAKAHRDRRFKGAAWEEPIFDMIRQSYVAVADQLLKGVDAIEGLDPKQKEQLRFATESFVEAMSPANFALTNPQVLERIFETRGQNLITGLERILGDIAAGQIRHVGEHAFEIGTTLATTPGKVIKETPLYQLIHYAPTTPNVQATPILIFPPWINRFYILDLTPEKSFGKWAVDQGL